MMNLSHLLKCSTRICHNGIVINNGLVSKSNECDDDNLKLMNLDIFSNPSCNATCHCFHSQIHNKATLSNWCFKVNSKCKNSKLENKQKAYFLLLSMPMKLVMNGLKTKNANNSLCLHNTLGKQGLTHHCFYSGIHLVSI